MAGIVAMAIGVPAMVSGQEDVTLDADVGNADPVVEWKWEWQDPSHDEVSPAIELMPDQAMHKCVLVSDANGGTPDEIIWHFNDSGSDGILYNADDTIIDTEKKSTGDFTLVPKPTVPASPTDPCWVKLQAKDSTLYDKATTGAQKDCYCMYKGTWANVPMDLLPGAGIHYVQVQAIDDQSAESLWLINDVTILEKMQLDVDVAAVNFGAVENFVHKVVAGDAVWGGLDATIKNTGNVPIDVQVACAAGLTDGGAPANIIPEADLDAKVGAEAEQYLGACFDVNLASLTTTNLDLSIDIGQSTGQPVPSGAYSGTATVTALTAC